MFHKRAKDDSALNWHRAAILITLICGQAFPMMACDDTGAADDNLEQVGRQDRGRNPGNFSVNRGGGDGETLAWEYAIKYEDVILTPDGHNLLVMLPAPGPNMGFEKPGLVLGVVPLDGGPMVVFDDLRDVARINFSPEGEAAYLLLDGGRQIQVLHLNPVSRGLTYDLAGNYSVLDVSPSGRHLIASNLPKTNLEEALGQGIDCMNHLGRDGSFNRCEMAVVDVLSHKTKTHTFETALRDLDFSPVHKGEAVVTLTGPFVGETPTAGVAFVGLESGVLMAHIEFPNCSDELKIQPGGTLALLAPTHCRKDPISVIDLASRTFLKNMPGFGPVVISEDGKTAVGFTRKADMVTEWGIDQVMNIGLIIVDLETLAFQLVEYGDKAPAYVLTPDGESLYTYETTQNCDWEDNGQGTQELACVQGAANLRRLNLQTRVFQDVAGGDARLSRFAMSPDQSGLFVMDQGLLLFLDFETVSLNTELVSALGGDLLNITAQGDLLVVGHSDKPVFHLVPMNGAATTTLNPTL